MVSNTWFVAALAMLAACRATAAAICVKGPARPRRQERALVEQLDHDYKRMLKLVLQREIVEQ
jgi:hypothetical protein